jgi:uncharacterized membrane protein
VILGFVALFAPLHASLYRAVAAQQRGEKPLELGSAFSTLTQGLMPAIGAACIVVALSLLGVMFCYLPALLVPIFFGFTMGFAALHGLGGTQSARLSLQHAMKNLNWYVMFGILSIVMSMVASYVPVVGPMFAIAFHVRAYRYLFGDGSEPNLTS